MTVVVVYRQLKISKEFYRSNKHISRDHQLLYARYLLAMRIFRIKHKME